MDRDLCCPICYDVFQDPVQLSCSHSYCRSCLKNWWNGKRLLQCPICKNVSPTRDPPANKVLRNQCEVLQSGEGRAAPLCGLHDEELKLFCLDHQQPACLICQCSDAHAGHRFRPIDKQTGLLKLKLLREAKEDCESAAEHIQVQAQLTEGRIREQFKRLRTFLHKEEQLRISALRDEEKKKSQTLKAKIYSLSKQIAALSETLPNPEDTIRSKDAEFIHPLPDNPLIDVAKHLGNLTFNIWTKMKHLVSYTPVVLDPNSANEELIVSSDLTTVRCGQKQNVPDNPERFDCFRIVLGSEGFHSDSHSWDVDVGDSTDWFVGVASESVRRKGKHPSSLWRIGCVDGKYIARSQSDPSTALSPIKKLQKIRVYLDCSRGKLLFFDLDTNTHLHTFTHTFTEKLFPYFNTVSLSPMKVIPANLVLKSSHT
ncbi:nuclear factor 7, ovary [Kryptolebias marmoratus]|uniref:Uncharacterized protein n=1 Tax=Kryptolebias marmoratus TaxID=37003 RepID=A0A3Q2ZSU4_KRYMA|nr:nuclear factor 7, ovary [Kryptolebias marmoratus]